MPPCKPVVPNGVKELGLAEVIPPTVCEPEEEEGGVLLTWAGWAEVVVLLEQVVLVLWSPDEVLEVWKEDATAVGFRCDKRELSRDCSDRYGAEIDPKIKRKLFSF